MEKSSSEKSASGLLFEARDGIAIITFNRPEKKNAVTPEMMVRMAEAWRRFRDDESLRVAVLTGAGDAFCAGADLGRLIPLLSRARPPEDEFDRAILADKSIFYTAFLRNFELWKPVIAAVNGVALAGGMEILQATDLRFCSPEAGFGITEASLGLLPGGGSTVRLARQIPYVEAMRILLVAEPISAVEALRIGFVNELVPREHLLERAIDVARKITENGPLAIRKIKESVLRSQGRPLEDALDIETECLKPVMRSEDAREGPRAFMEKRKPNFTGR